MENGKKIVKTNPFVCKSPLHLPIQTRSFNKLRTPLHNLTESNNRPLKFQGQNPKQLLPIVPQRTNPSETGTFDLINVRLQGGGIQRTDGGGFM